ncbi:hypothetical protein O181_042107 [Austropuccinia psidii MF-1]|uniref:Uncharacterized protein n=1 Tax=Austropuccinia psidii MF-1 TaxID=1389203 RepID=A0A9Q3HFJ3_9BASI|nr:hypothetical protein [Austropuccinia psidii MF-1]
MSNYNRYKSHSESPNIHSYEPVKEVLQSVKGQGLGNVATNPPRSDELLADPEKFLKEEEILRYSNGWNTLSSNPQIKKTKEYHSKMREKSKEEAPVASISKPQANQPPQEGKKKKKKNWRKSYSPSYRIPKVQKRCHGQCLQHGQNLDGIQGQRRTKNKKTSFPNKRTLSPDVVNTLTEIKNSILPLKDIKNSLLSLQEINNKLSSLTKIALQNKKEIDNIKFMV